MNESKNDLITVNRKVLKENIKQFISAQFGEDCDESMERYIDQLIGQTEIGLDY